MDKKIKFPVIWDGEQYKDIETFDCRIVKLNGKYGGYMTVIPISPTDYRKENPTKAYVKIIENAEWTLFEIHSDWGEIYTMNIHNSLKDKIEIAKKAAINKELIIN